MSKCNGNQTCEVFLKFIIPALGALSANILFFSSLPAVLRVHAYLKKTTAEKPKLINPLPYTMQMANCFLWFAYSLLSHDYFLFFANIFGFVLSLYYLVVLYAFSFHFPYNRLQDRTFISLLLFGSGFAMISCLIVFISLQSVPYSTQQTIMGSCCIFVLVVFYSSPLTVLYKVLKTRDASDFYFPLSLTCCLNGGFWVIYGLAISDPFIWAPNMVGVALGAFQLVLIFIFNKKKNVEDLEKESFSLQE